MGMAYPGMNFDPNSQALSYSKYRKVPKFSDARKLCFYLPKIQEKRPNLARVFRQKDANGIANSEDPDHSLSWVCTVCSDLSVRKLCIITVAQNILNSSFLVARVASRENLLFAHEKNKGVDQLISTFVFHYMDSIISSFHITCIKFMPLARVCSCAHWYVLGLVRTPKTGFLVKQLSYY